MSRLLAALASGLLFGLGLTVSGMADPAKVLNFLDIAGQWDPSLAFVLGGAVAVSLIGFRVAGRGRPLLADAFSHPSASEIDAPLLAGAAIFGIGWGLSGFCPGPAIVSATLAAPGTLVFLPAMVAGLWIGGQLKRAAGAAA